MGKVLIQYYSETGRTQQMADLVAEGAASVMGIKVRLKTIDESTVDDIFWADGIALGAPCHLASVPWRVKKFWDEKRNLWEIVIFAGPAQSAFIFDWGSRLRNFSKALQRGCQVAL